ncbi:MAG TPA: hypothetical protein PKD85_06975, partial [Saprospiraceae bacterium]|nr:hypothetical protein [Saprospiraceae bacterium]
MPIKIMRTFLKGIPLDLKASSKDSVKLTVKFMKPINPIPIIDIRISYNDVVKFWPNRASAKLPAANVMCRMSRSKPKNIPTTTVEPIKTP